MSKIYLIRCPKCNLENYAFTVASGICAWCGFEATEEDVEKNKRYGWISEEDDNT